MIHNAGHLLNNHVISSFVIKRPFELFITVINISALVVIRHKIFVNQLMLLILSQVDCHFRLGQKV